MKRSLESYHQEDLFNTSETSSLSGDEIDLTSEIFSEIHTESSFLSLQDIDMGKKPFFKPGPPDENFTEAVSFCQMIFLITESNPVQYYDESHKK